jgi:hypothetical protein
MKKTGNFIAAEHCLSTSGIQRTSIYPKSTTQLQWSIEKEFSWRPEDQGPIL